MKKRTPKKGVVEQTIVIKLHGRELAALESITVSLGKISYDLQEIRNGMRFICERWKS